MYRAVVIGASAGGIDAILTLLGKLKRPFKYPIIIAIHLNPHFKSELAKIIENNTGIKCLEVEDKMKIEKGTVYVAPPNYHTLVEKNYIFSLSVTEKVCFARPSIDILFESAADAYRNRLVGILLTGSNHDGTDGISKIIASKGLAIVQNPEEAKYSGMPSGAIKYSKPDKILTLDEIAELLNSFTRKDIK